MRDVGVGRLVGGPARSRAVEPEHPDRAGVDDPLAGGGASRPQDVQRAADIDVVEILRSPRPEPVHRREMEDEPGVPAGRAHRVRIPDVDADPLHVEAVEVLLVGTGLGEGHDARTTRQQRPHHRRPDEAGRPRDDHPIAGLDRKAHPETLTPGDTGIGYGASGRARPAAPQRPFRHRAPELEQQPGTVVRIAQDVVERGDEVVDLLLPADQRRQQLDDVDVVGGHLGEDPVAVEERDHHQLREHRRAKVLQRVEPAAQGARLRLAELEADHQPLAAYLVEHLVALDERSQRDPKRLTRPRRRARRCARRRTPPASPARRPSPAGYARTSSSASAPSPAS